MGCYHWDHVTINNDSSLQGRNVVCGLFGHAEKVVFFLNSDDLKVINGVKYIEKHITDLFFTVHPQKYFY